MLSLNFKFFKFVMILIALYTSKSIAIPLIISSDITKNITGDEIVTLSGVGFTAGPDIVLYSAFTGGVHDEIIPLDNPTVGAWARNGNSARFMKYNGNDIGFKLYDGLDDYPVLNAVFPNHTADVFVSYTITMPDGAFFPYAEKSDVFPDLSSWKMAWLLDDNGYAYKDGKADVCVPSHVGYGSMIIGGNDGTLTYTGHGSEWWDFNGSNHLSFYTKVALGNPQTDNGTIFFQAASQSKGLYTSLIENKPAAILAEDTSYEYNMINFPGWYRKGDFDNFQAIYDNIYVAIGSNHIARLELTDSPVYASSTKVFTIPYEEWTDNNIRINIKTLALPDVHKLFLYVVDKFDKRTQAGYSLNSVKSTRSIHTQYLLILD